MFATMQANCVLRGLCNTILEKLMFLYCSGMELNVDIKKRSSVIGRTERTIAEVRPLFGYLRPKCELLEYGIPSTCDCVLPGSARHIDHT